MPTPAGDNTFTGVPSNVPFSVTVFTSAARTADPIPATDKGFGVPNGANALVVVVDITAATSTPSTVFNIEGYDKASGKWYTILASAALVGTGTTVLRVIPSGAVTANLRADDVLPEIIRVRPVHGNANSQTYTVGAHFSAV